MFVEAGLVGWSGQPVDRTRTRRPKKRIYNPTSAHTSSSRRGESGRELNLAGAACSDNYDLLFRLAHQPSRGGVRRPDRSSAATTTPHRLPVAASGLGAGRLLCSSNESWCTLYPLLFPRCERRCSAVWLRPPGARGVRGGWRQLGATSSLFIPPASQRPTAAWLPPFPAPRLPAPKGTLPSPWFSPSLSSPPPVRWNGAAAEKEGFCLLVPVRAAAFLLLIRCPAGGREFLLGCCVA